MKKRIRINQLRPGMFVASTNRSWLHLPFFRRKIRDMQTIEKLKAAGVTEALIDLRKGDDLASEDQSDTFDLPEVISASLNRSTSVHAQVLAGTTALMEKVREGGEVLAQEADAQVNLMLDQIMADPQSMLCISVLKNVDEYTFTHCVNTSILGLFVGKSLNLPRHELLELGKGVLLHDIGKCMIPTSILAKPGKLDEQESIIIRSHVVKGVRYLQKMKGISRTVLEIVSQHHERIDGSGYPAGLEGSQISWFAKICTVLDVYDALIHENYYKDSKDPTNVLKKMASCVGTAYDEAAFRALADCIGIYPPGTILMLDSGEIAVAYEPNSQNPYRPKVLLLTDVDGSFHSKLTPVHLTETIAGKHKYKRSILTTMSLEDTNFNPFEIMGKYSLQSTATS